MNEGENEQPIEAGAAGASEGAVAEPTTSDVQSMYDELGIKATAPSGKPKGRPKATDVRAKDVQDDDSADSKPGRKEDVKSNSKSKDAPAADKNGDSGDNTDAKGAKVGKDSGAVHDESAEADSGVRDAKSSAQGDSERGSKEDAQPGNDGVTEEDGEQEDASEEGKRPGKSNPAIERRFQQLTEEKRQAEQRAAELEQRLQERERAVAQAQISQEDPEYTIDDFRKVRDENGNILDLDPNEAELAWRRWKDGYDQRASEREAQFQHQQAQAQRQEQMAEQIMRSSVEAYDTLAGMMDEFPELVSTSGQFDQTFAAKVMPIINEAVIYKEGTEPGNPEGNPGVVLGLKINPKIILAAMREIRDEKRALPLNGVNDNVESRSNVSVPHGRSSDPAVNAANELYRELGINKRV